MRKIPWKSRPGRIHVDLEGLWTVLPVKVMMGLAYAQLGMLSILVISNRLLSISIGQVLLGKCLVRVKNLRWSKV